MKQVKFGTTGKLVPAIALGCMRMSSLTPAQGAELLEFAVEQGINFFDHADIYGGGECETIFRKSLEESSLKREDLTIQSKCGIVPGMMYDFSKEHILASVDGSLKRLGTDYLDVLLLHRPDALMEPEEVAEAFDTLESAGKVRFFGVSNQNPIQMELLRKYVKQPLAANQLQASAAHAGMFSAGMQVNMKTEGGVDRDGSVLDYCRLHEITIQAWSPFQYGMIEGVFLGHENYASLNAKINEIAGRYGVTNTTIAVAWLLRHPAGMQVLAGSMSQTRLAEICKAADLELTRREWYEIYLADGNLMP